MAKQKKAQLMPDLIAAANMDFIRKLGNIANNEEVKKVWYSHAMKEYSKRYTPQYMKRIINEQLDQNDIKFGDQLCAIKCINNWYYGGRQVYVFDDDFAELLSLQTNDDLNIGADTIEQLPCNSFYVQRRHDNSIGFFVDVQGNSIVFAEYFENNDGGISEKGLPIQIQSNKTIAESIYDIMADNNVNRSKAHKLVAKIAELMQYVVYLSAVNAEITPATKRQAVKSKQTGEDATTPQKSAVANVGYRIGSTLRKHSTDTNTENVVYQCDPSAHGKPKSPHLRRAHFHRFKTKKGYVTKWVHTVFVNADGGDMQTTLHKIK